MPQAGCNLSSVFNRKLTEVAVALLEHEVVCLPNLFWGGSEGTSGVCEARFGKGGVGVIFVAVFFGLGSLKVVGNGCGLGVVGGRHFSGDEQSVSV